MMPLLPVSAIFSVSGLATMLDRETTPDHIRNELCDPILLRAEVTWDELYIMLADRRLLPWSIKPRLWYDPVSCPNTMYIVDGVTGTNCIELCAEPWVTERAPVFHNLALASKWD